MAGAKKKELNKGGREPGWLFNQRALAKSKKYQFLRKKEQLQKK